MPLYEYSCNDCRTRFEVLQSVGAGADGLHCPSCGGEALSKELSTFAASSGGRPGVDAAGCDAPGCGAGSGFT